MNETKITVHYRDGSKEVFYGSYLEHDDRVFIIVIEDENEGTVRSIYIPLDIVKLVEDD